MARDDKKGDASENDGKRQKFTTSKLWINTVS